MRNLKVLSLCGILLAGLAVTAAAQSTSNQTSSNQTPGSQSTSNWDGRGYYLNVSLGGQAQDETLTSSATFDLYGETGAVASAQTFGGGPFFEIAAGRRVWRNFGLGLAYTNIQSQGGSVVTARVPHPIVRNQPREVSADAGELDHSESAVHLQFSWVMPITNEFKLMFMAGPSFFSLRQEVATVLPQDIGDEAPFTSVTINNITRTEVKDSPVGINIGVDGTYLFRQRISLAQIGVGGFLRYAGAGGDFEGVGGNGSARAGGAQAGIGLRLRF